MTNEELLVAMSNMMDQRLDEKLEPLKKDMSEVKDRVTNIENRVTNIENRVTNIENRVTNIETQVAKIEDRVTNIETQVAKIEDRVTNIETQVTKIKNRVTNIELDIENDIRPGIITLCDAYGTQFDRYSISIESHEKMKTDIEVLKSIVSRHFDLLPEERRAIGQ